MIKISEVFPSLTRRQSEVCALLVQGHSNKEIARLLGISNRTVEDHRTEIFRRSEVSDCHKLIYKALGSPEIVAQ
jgi:DNA-binding NarL/FixJ family response regulator